jgi:hypothetical protein
VHSRSKWILLTVTTKAPDNTGSRRELEALVRFGLDSLGETNSHHEFELLCLELARRRIATNLIPATGPVSAGGDDGADAESFWTSLAVGPDDGIALPTSEKVVIACTTQRRGLRSKIVADATKMNGLEPDHVVFFLSNPMPVKQRHDAIDAASAASGARVDIWDGRAIAHELCDSDLRWIAAEFLRIPIAATAGAVAPKSAAPSPDGVADLRLGPTLRDLAEARSGLHESIDRADDHSARRWLKQLEWIVKTGREDVAARAIPPLVFGHGAVRQTLLGTEHHVTRYMSFVAEWSNEGTDLEDAVSLVEAATAAAARDAGQFIEDDLERWRTDLLAILKARRKAHEGDGYPRVLQAQLTLVPSLSDARAASPTSSLRITTTGEVDLREIPVREADSALKLLGDYARKGRHSWRSIRLATAVFEAHATVFVDSDQYTRIRDGLDELTSRGSAALSVERAAMFRAVELAETKQLAAIRECYLALKHSTLDSHEMVNSMSLLASQYWNRDMYAASMFFGLAASGVGYHSSDMDVDDRRRSIRLGAAIGAASAYRSGAWLLAADMFDLAFSAVGEVKFGDWDALGYFFWEAARGHGVVTEVLRAHRPEAFKRYKRRLTGAGRIVRKMRFEKFTAGKTESTTAQRLKDWGMSSPLGDLGRRRSMEWTALGVRWRLESSTDRLPSFALLDLALQLQIVATEVSDWELDVTGGVVTIMVENVTKVDPRHIARFVDYNVWEVKLPIDNSGSAAFLAAATIIAARCSFPSVDALIKRLYDRCPPDGLMVPATFAFAFQSIATDRAWPKQGPNVEPLPEPRAVPLPEPPRLAAIPAKVRQRVEMYWRRTHPRLVMLAKTALAGSTPSATQSKAVYELMQSGLSMGHVANAIALRLAHLRLNSKGLDQLTRGDVRWLRDADRQFAFATFDEIGDLTDAVVGIIPTWAAHCGLEVEVLIHLTPKDLLSVLERFGWFDEPLDANADLTWLRSDPDLGDSSWRAKL